MVIDNAGIGLTGVPKHLIYITIGKMVLQEQFRALTISKKRARPDTTSNFSNEDLQKYLFDFARTIGAFIIYIFIEVMRPSENKNVQLLLPKQIK